MHLFHPALVHFSVAFVITGGIVEAVGLLVRRDGAARFGGVLVVIGTLSLVPTLASGYLAANTVPVDESALGLLGAHERNGWILLGVLLAAQFFKGWNRGRLEGPQRWIYAALLAAGVLIAAYSAFLGGKLVYGAGVGVQRASGALEDRLERVAGDLRVLPQAAHGVGVPVGAERHVDA